MIFISIRYFVIIHHDRKYLEYCWNIIEERLKWEYKLRFNDKSMIYDIRDGFDFLGYRFKVVNNKTIITVSRKTYRNVKGNIRKLDSNIGCFDSYSNYYGSFKYSCDSRIKHFIGDIFL